MSANAFPRYFSIGSKYSPIRGYIRCDNEYLCFVVSASGSEYQVSATLETWLDRMRAGRMSEVSKHDIDSLNASWGAYGRCFAHSR